MRSFLFCGIVSLGLLGCDGGNAEVDGGIVVDRDSGRRADAGRRIDAWAPQDDAGRDAGSPASDAGTDAGSPECSNESRWGLGPESWCPNAIGVVTGGPELCPPPAAGTVWVLNPLELGPETYCMYESEGRGGMLPDFCTLPRGPMGEQPWDWLEADCVVVGP